jgi:Phage capsid family
MSPRVIPKHERDLLKSMGSIPVGSGPDDNSWIGRYVEADARLRQGRCSSVNPYQPTCSHSYWRDLLLVAEADARQKKATENVVLRGRDQGATDYSDHGLKEARERLRTTLIKDRSEQRDIGVSSANEGLRPSLPGYLSTVWGQAARASGTLADAFGIQELLPGMIDTSSNLPVVKIPRLSAGAAVAVQSSDNQAVQETDPTTTSNSSPVSTVSGQVDLSRQLFEFSQPGFDMAITDDLSRAHAAALDTEIIFGSASAGRTRGLLNWSGILSVSGVVTNAQTFLNSVWQAYSQIAGSSGYGAADTSGYVTILHPRRLAWLSAGISGVMPPDGPLLPGTVVVSAGVGTTAGAGTNEDTAFVVEKSQIVLLSSGPTIRLFEEVGSTNLTIRILAHREFAVVAKNATAIAKVVGLTPPSGF